MRLTILFLMLGFIQVSARSLAQEVTLNGKNLPLQQIFSDMRAQTGYDFLFDLATVERVAPIPEVALNQVSLEEALKTILEKTPLSFTITDQAVVISQRKDLPVLGQSRQDSTTFRGTVVDEEGRPLSGASIEVEGEGIVTQTNSSGVFEVRQVPDGAGWLRIRYLGFKDLMVSRSNALKAGNTFVMEQDEQELQQVNVVLYTGYQELPKDQLTGAATVISGEELEQRTTVSGNLLESLEGRLPGLVYNHRNPNVAEDERLSIRGIATFDGVKTPLIVIDGFPTETNLNAINPNDIASVSVLRDAAASTIYGARAANGVIVVETKKGQQGKPRIAFRASGAIQSAPDFGELGYAGSGTYVDIRYDVANASTSSRPSLTSTQPDPVAEIVFDQRDGLISEQEAQEQLQALKEYNNLSDYHELFYRPSMIQNYELFMSGGSEQNTYRLGLNYVDNQLSEKRTANDRVVLTVNDTYHLSDRLRFDFQGVYTHEDAEQPGVIPDYESLVPYKPLIDENGMANPDFRRMVGAAELNETGKEQGLFDRWRRPYQDYLTEQNQRSRNTFRGQGRLHARIVEGLSINLGGAYENSSTAIDRLVDEQNFLIRDLLNRSAQLDPSTGMALFTHVPRGDLLQKSTIGIKSYTLRGQVNADFTFGSKERHNISGIAGVEWRRKEESGALTSYFGYDGQSLLSSPIDLQLLSSRTIVSGFPDLRFGTASLNTSQYFNEDYIDRRFRSYYSQATYVYDRRYVLTGSIRLDQSNLFGTDPRYRNKPQWSGGLSWNIHREAFMDELSGWLSELKIRAAYGLTGNVPSSNSGRFLIFRTYRRSNLIPAASYNSITSPENQAIRWENTRNLNIGLDIGLLANRFSATIDWYHKRSVDVLATTPADATTGWTSYRANTAEIDNKGVELGLRSRNITGPDFSWTSTLTGSFNRNEIVEVYIDNPTGYRSDYYVDASTPIAGYPLNALLSYRYAGLNSDGIPTMINKDGEIQKIAGSDQIHLEDLVNSGTTTPRHVIGFGNLFSWGSVDLFAMLMYYGGHMSRVEQPSVYADFPLQGVENYWRQPGDEVNTRIPGLRPRFGSPDYSAFSFGGAIYNHAEEFVRSADQLRLTDLNLTWHVPPSILGNLPLESTQLRLQGQNLWKWTFSGNAIDMDAIDPVSGIRGLHTRPVYSISLFAQF